MEMSMHSQVDKSMQSSAPKVCEGLYAQKVNKQIN